VTAGSYADAATVPKIVVDTHGLVTSMTNTSIAISAAAVTSGMLSVARGGTGKDTTGLANGQILIGNTVNTGFDLATIAQTAPVIVVNGKGTITLSHASSGVTAKTYGNATIIPVVTVDAFGHITAVSNAAITASGLPASTANGQLLIGNTVSGGFDENTLTPGNGITIVNGKGTAQVNANSGIVSGKFTATSNGLNSTGWTRMTYGTQIFVNGSNYSSSNGILNVGRAGIISITASYEWFTGSVYSGNTYAIRIFKNNNTVVSQNRVLATNNSQVLFNYVSSIDSATSSSDFYEVQVSHSTGLGLGGSTSTNSEFTYCSVT